MSAAGASGLPIEVVCAGALTTVQDLGRPGCESAGVPRGGAFDPWAARAANRLVGNRDGAALLEITLAGPTLRFAATTTIAWIGAAFDVVLEGAPLRPGWADLARAGTELVFGRARSGARAWLAFAGGLDLPSVLGSRATELAGGFGGHEGRALVAGDRLRLGHSAASPQPAETRRFAEPSELLASAESREVSLHVLPGPHAELVAGGLGALAGEIWSVDPRSDRRGVRFAGARLELGDHAPLRSLPILPGAIELPPAGLPIALGVDAPVTGGYPWIAQIVAADLGRLARLAPGERVRFEAVDFDRAEAALAARWRELERFAPRVG